MIKTAKFFFSLVLLALVFIQCTKEQEPHVEPEHIASEKSSDNLSSLGAQVAALPAYVDYANQVAIASQKFKVQLEAQPSAAARDAYIGNLIALQAIGDAASKLQFVQAIGFTDQQDYDTWMANSISKLNDLYNDPFFDNLSPEQTEQGIADGLEHLPPDHNPPPNQSANEGLNTCLSLAWKIYGLQVDLCYLQHSTTSTLNAGALSGCLDDRWVELLDEIDLCHDIYD